MKQRADTPTAKFFRPKFLQTIEWQFNGHRREGLVAAFVSNAESKIDRGERLYNLRHRTKIITLIAISVIPAHSFANSSPWRA
jgi:hypothetical protein